MFDQLQIGQLKENLFNCPVAKRHSFIIVDCLDSQFVETVGIILFSPDSVLNCIVPIEVFVLEGVGEVVGIRFRRRGQDASGGELRVLDQVGSGLAG